MRLPQCGGLLKVVLQMLMLIQGIASFTCMLFMTVFVDIHRALPCFDCL